MIVYFSGTGNSRYAAEFLAYRLEDTLVDTGRRIKEGDIGGLHSETPWVFVAPTYAWQMPRIFEAHLRAVAFSGSKDAYFVLTCGSEIGDAGSYAEKLCGEIGLHYKGILPVVMPENYIAMFNVPSAEECATILEQAKPVLQQGENLIRNREDFPAREITVKDRKYSGIVNKTFYRMFVKAKDFYATDACTGCGLCERLCPLNNVTVTEGRPVWGPNCTHCMACICRCPAEAIEYGKISKGKPRYQCPPYQEV